MPQARNRLSRVMLTTAISLVLFGCATDSQPLTTDEQIEALDKDLKLMFDGQQPLAAPLSLSDAMARGIAYNLDHRVASMERMIATGEVNMALLDVLPSLDVKAGYVGRDDAEIREARSPGGTQTLPPSQFQEEDRRIAGVEASWDVLDAGISMVQARQQGNRARVADEQRRKVVHNIIQDVRSAYWRAASAQVLSPRIADALRRNQQMIADLDALAAGKGHGGDSRVILQQQARLLEISNGLMNLQTQMNTAKTELAALINLPPGTEYTLAVNEGDILSIPATERVQAAPQDLELVALMVRPELREDLLMSRISATETRLTALRSFPGLEAAFGYNYDSDDYISDQNWTNFSLSLAGNLMKLFTLPVKFEQNKNRERLTEMQRQAMVVSVLTQVNLARQRLDAAEDRLALLRKLMEVQQRLATPEEGTRQDAKTQNLLAAASALEQEQVALNARGRFHMAYADYENAYGRLLNSVGIDPLPPLHDTNDLAAMSKTIEARTSVLTPRIFGKVVEAIRAKMPQGLSVDEGKVVPASYTAPADTASVATTGHMSVVAPPPPASTPIPCVPPDQRDMTSAPKPDCTPAPQAVVVEKTVVTETVVTSAPISTAKSNGYNE